MVFIVLWSFAGSVVFRPVCGAASLMKGARERAAPQSKGPGWEGLGGYPFLPESPHPASLLFGAL